MAMIDRCLLDLFLQLKAQVICFLHIKPMKAIYHQAGRHERDNIARFFPSAGT